MATEFSCDLRELKRVHRALRTLSASNRALLRAECEESLFHEFCRVAVEEGGYRLAWVTQAEHDETKTVRPVASAGVNDGYLESIQLSWADTPLGQGPTGTAIRTGKPSVIQNIQTDPREAPWFEVGVAHGFASFIALPLLVEGSIIGAITIAAPEPDAFGADEVALLSETADDLAFGIETLRMRMRHRAAEDTIRRMAYFDALTGLPNRLQLQERLNAALDVARAENRPLAVLHLQIGSFREITEALGYRESDLQLQEIAKRMPTFETGEIVARVAEDAFVVVLPRGDAEVARGCAKRILATLAAPIELSGLLLDSRATIGITLYPGHGADAEALLRRAAAANFQARQTGQYYIFYAGGLDTECTRRLALMGELRRAIDGDELRLFCQPKVEISSGQVSGVEALVRWEHPSLGMIEPDRFIPLAESAGLITPLTYWVLGAALRQSYVWRAMGVEVPISVNLSAHDLRDAQLLERVRDALTTWGASPEWIAFEIKESTLMNDPAGACKKLSKLKQLGVELFIDDFGTGYSSLAYLQKLPIDSIKIDQSFVSAMTSDEDSQVIVRSTVEMAHNLGLHVVAEGVETRAIADCLAQLGCEDAQGFCISRPMPASQYVDWRAGFSWIAD
ncbi:putative bifunctional diguanylate cyclase/phosphodiesterase [Aromatoleum evansii]|uniref:putative bifunctional diguanylate cyclase/phosphodiesterase n=1 Tax=Aromatoleum evansii TaxID=59406 RepID=UPI00145D626F|nr:EAL domain-containing protein [Aromatoleum evansii]NMG30211.1 EAL domain-containing protein [Aromatoleum evansii]